jgi:hypothetical protein
MEATEEYEERIVRKARFSWSAVDKPMNRNAANDFFASLDSPKSGQSSFDNGPTDPNPNGDGW